MRFGLIRPIYSQRTMSHPFHESEFVNLGHEFKSEK